MLTQVEKKYMLFANDYFTSYMVTMANRKNIEAICNTLKEDWKLHVMDLFCTEKQYDGVLESLQKASNHQTEDDIICILINTMEKKRLYIRIGASSSIQFHQLVSA